MAKSPPDASSRRLTPDARRHLRRRDFLKQTGAAAGFWMAGRPASGQERSPNEKLNVGVVGVAGRGADNLAGVAGENVAALCDVDAIRLDKAAERFPKARKYRDFRKMIDEGRDLDAVVVSTADHTHAPATLLALRAGKHVYCEKPLTHTVAEARRVAEEAARHKVATQTGTQIHAGDNYRRVVELVQSGAIGEVRDVHVWVSGTKVADDRPKAAPPVPPNLDWDLWLGPAPYRPYHPVYIPFNWRSWWDFGGGQLADMGCHYQDLPFWALKLRHPLSVEAEGPPVHPETTPAWQVVRYDYGAVKLTWYHGGRRPELPPDADPKKWDSGVLFLGAKGKVIANYGRHELLPREDFRDFKRPGPFIPNSVGHHAEWIRACKTGSPTTCAFDYGGALTEAVLLGNVAYRAGRKIDWDAASLKARGCPEADAFIRREYRQGWEV